MDINWSELVFHSAFFARVNSLAKNRFNDDTLADEALSFVLHQLSDNNWQACKAFTGRAKPETYLYRLAANNIEEFARKRFGRPRPPEWLKREGELWVRLWQQMCLERKLKQTIIDLNSHTWNLEPEIIHRTIQIIKAKLPWCGVSTMPVSLDAEQIGEDPTLKENLSHNFTPEDALLAESLDSALGLIVALLQPQSCGEHLSITHHAKKLTKWLPAFKAIKLTEQERLVLRMHFKEGLKLSVISQALNVQNHVPGRQIKQAITKIKLVMDAHQLSWDDFIPEAER